MKETNDGPFGLKRIVTDGGKTFFRNTNGIFDETGKKVMVSKAQERRFKKQMKELGREEFTRRELIEDFLDVINVNIWDLSDGELEDLGEVLGYDVKCFKHGIFFVKTLDKDDD